MLVNRFIIKTFKAPQYLRSVIYIAKRRDSDIAVKEIKIDVPWGHIAGRHWNGSDSSRKPVLCLHGWKDNAATFDRLLPILVPSLNNYQFLSIDLPGHGLSSHYPPGMIYRLNDSVMWVLLVAKKLGWSKFALMGHSLGATAAFIFAAMCPKLVTQLVTIDALTPVIFSNADILSLWPETVQHILSMEDKLRDGNLSTFTMDEMLQKMQSSHMMGMHETAYKTLMTRAVTEDPVGSGRYRFCHDIRVQYLPVTMYTHDQIAFFAKYFKSGLLHIKAEKGVNYMSNEINTNIEGWIKEGNHKRVEFVQIKKATHHLHLIDPDPVAQHIINFMD